MNCRSCGSYVKNLFTIGPHIPMLAMCTECSLVQLRDTPPKLSKPFSLDEAENPNEFIECLSNPEEYTFELPYIGSIIAQDAFHEIAHERISYFSLFSLEHLLNRHNLQIVDVKIKGIMFKVKVKQVGTVTRLRREEEEKKLNNWGTYFLFALRFREKNKK